MAGKARDLRADAVTIINAALAAADPERLVKRVLDVEDGRITPEGFSLDLSSMRHIYLLAMGKAGATMARGAEAALGRRVTQGVAVVKDGYGVPGLQFTETIEAAHPLPEQRNVAAAHRIMELAQSADEGDLVVCLISGGSSALMALPAPGISLEDVRLVTGALLKSGGGIHEINAVRKHITMGAGGRLAAAAAPARVLSLIVSDVIGDRLDVVASGPTVPDVSTYAEAFDVLINYGLVDSLPGNVIRYLRRGAAGGVDETPKPGDPVFRGVHNLIICSNRTSVDAAAGAATGLGFRVRQLSPLTGSAEVEGREFAQMAMRMKDEGRAAKIPVCIIAGGETTVTVTGEGKGGRAQEFTLAAAQQVQGREDLLVFAFGTDGTDGPTDAAGAFADGTTIGRASGAGMDAEAFLKRNDSYPFFSALGDLIVTGPTGTNVNDIYCALMGK